MTVKRQRPSSLSSASAMTTRRRCNKAPVQQQDLSVLSSLLQFALDCCNGIGALDPDFMMRASFL